MNKRMLLYVSKELIAIKMILDECEGHSKLKAQIDAAILEAFTSVGKMSPPKQAS